MPSAPKNPGLVTSLDGPKVLEHFQQCSLQGHQFRRITVKVKTTIVKSLLGADQNSGVETPNQ